MDFYVVAALVVMVSSLFVENLILRQRIAKQRQMFEAHRARAADQQVAHATTARHQGDAAGYKRGYSVGWGDGNEAVFRESGEILLITHVVDQVVLDRDGMISRIQQKMLEELWSDGWCPRSDMRMTYTPVDSNMVSVEMRVVATKRIQFPEASGRREVEVAYYAPTLNVKGAAPH